MRLLRKHIVAVFIATLLLTACAAPPPGIAYDLPAKNKFQACPYQEFVGKNVDEVKVKLDIDKKTYRLLEPDSVMTMDFSPDRINVVFNPDTKKIERVFCG
jgi:predicted component of type VI protein secretion system